MCDRVLVYDRCIAMQLKKDAPPPPPPPPPPPVLPFEQLQLQQTEEGAKVQQKGMHLQYGSLHRKQTENNQRVKDQCHSKSPQGNPQGSSPNKSDKGPFHLNENEDYNTSNVTTLKGVSSPLNSNSGSSGTPTPTNGISPLILNGSNGINYQSGIQYCNYQEGYQLFQCWVATNAACVWDNELVRSVKGAHFVGVLVGGFILIGGSARVLAAISHAHSRALLNPPPGWTIVVLGEMHECEVSVVHRGQFTPLGDALCWAIHRLTNTGTVADQKRIHNSLLTHFPAMAPPEPALVHAALSDLIRQRKVYHTGRGYGIVQANTYTPEPIPKSPPSHPNHMPPPRLLTTSEALTRAHGTAEVEKMGAVTHAAIQTDLVDLLSGVWPNSTILTARPPHNSTRLIQRTGSFRGGKDSLVPLLGECERSSTQGKCQSYVGVDMSDVTIKGGEKGSVLSKILRVSNPRRRLASFSAQFPPPEWSDPHVPVKHLHSVATQTRSSKHPGGPEACSVANYHWAPRSSTLPRRPPRPLSSSPIPLDVHFRPHSTSPAPAKLPYNNSNKYNTSPYHKVKIHAHLNPQSSSSAPSPCVTSSHSSRNNSPSLLSTTPTQTESNASRSLSPYNGNSPKHKSMSPAHNSTRNHSISPHPTSPLHLHHASLSPHRTAMRKPPLSSSPHHTPPKDHRRKALSLMPHESINLDNQSSRNDQWADNFELKNHSPTRHHSNSPNRSRIKTKGQQSHSQTRSNSEGNSKVKSIPHKIVDDDINTKRLKCKGDKKGDEETSKDSKYDRSNLQLHLSSEVPMNNFKKVVSSPQKPEGLKNNVFHENLSSIVKGSVSDLTSKNLGYRDINKCDKKLYAGESHQSTDLGENDEESSPPLSEEINEYIDKPSTPSIEEKKKLKLSLPSTEKRILSEGCLKKIEKKLQRKSLIALDNKKESLDKEKNFLSPQDEVQSVKTYPSLSDLNLTFSSLTAQKILQGVSVNSIDTLVEVNMVAERRKQPRKEGVTNTDFGFV